MAPKTASPRDPYQLEREFVPRQQATAGLLARLRERLSGLIEQQQEHLVAGRFDDAEAAQAEISNTRDLVATAEEHNAAVAKAAAQVSAERQRLDTERALTEAEALHVSELAKANDSLKRLHELFEECRLTVREGLSHESLANNAGLEAHQLRERLNPPATQNGVIRHSAYMGQSPVSDAIRSNQTWWQYFGGIPQ